MGALVRRTLRGADRSRANGVRAGVARAAGVVSLLSADAIARTVAAGAALVAAVVLLAAVIGSMLHLVALRMLPRFPVRDGGGPARPSAAVRARMQDRPIDGDAPPELR